MVPSNIANPGDFDAAEAARTLRWWLDAGVEFVVDETPHDRFAKTAALDPHTAQARPTPAREPRPTIPSASSTIGRAPSDIAAPDAAATAARGLAASAPDLATLRSILDNFEGCALKPLSLYLRMARQGPRSCLSAKLPAATKIEWVGHSSAEPDNCSIACCEPSDSIAAKCI